MKKLLLLLLFLATSHLAGLSQGNPTKFSVVVADIISPSNSNVCHFWPQRNDSSIIDVSIQFDFEPDSQMTFNGYFVRVKISGKPAMKALKFAEQGPYYRQTHYDLWLNRSYPRQYSNNHVFSFFKERFKDYYVRFELYGESPYVTGSAPVIQLLDSSFSFEGPLCHSSTITPVGSNLGNEEPALLTQEGKDQRNPGFEGPTSVSFFPNPFSDSDKITLELPEVHPAHVTLYAPNGKSMGSWTLTRETGQEPLSHSLSRLTPGLYFLQVRTGEYSTHLKVLKQ